METKDFRARILAVENAYPNRLSARDLTNIDLMKSDLHKIEEGKEPLDIQESRLRDVEGNLKTIERKAGI